MYHPKSHPSPYLYYFRHSPSALNISKHLQHPFNIRSPYPIHQFSPVSNPTGHYRIYCIFHGHVETSHPTTCILQIDKHSRNLSWNSLYTIYGPMALISMRPIQFRSDPVDLVLLQSFAFFFIYFYFFLCICISSDQCGRKKEQYSLLLPHHILYTVHVHQHSILEIHTHESYTL